MHSEKTSINPLKGEDKYTVYFFLKVSILTIIFSLLWILMFPEEHKTYNDHHNEQDTPGQKSTREKTANDTDEADTILEDVINKAFEQESTKKNTDEHSAPHFSDARSRYNRICSKYESICAITTWDGSYTENEQLMYQAVLIFMFNTINNYLDTTLERDLKYIKFYEDSSMSSRRGSATQDYVKMNTQRISSFQEFWQVLTHELGHTIDFAVIKGYTSKKDTKYTEFGKPKRSVDDPSIDFYEISRIDENTRRGSANFRDFVSGYGMRGMYEDLAEFNNLRFNHQDYLQSLARENNIIAEKYRYFDDLYTSKYFQTAHSSYPETNERVRDTTRIHDS